MRMRMLKLKLMPVPAALPTFLFVHTDIKDEVCGQR